MGKYQKPDVGIQEYLERRWSVSFQQKGRALMGKCPFHSHATENLNLRIWPEDNTYVCSCDQEGGTIWDLIHKHEGLPNWASEDFDETILHVCRIMDFEPQLRQNARLDITDTVRGVYRAIEKELSAISFPEPNAHFQQGNKPHQYLYRGIDVMQWLHAGVGMLTQDSVAKLVQVLGPQRLRAAGLKGWKNNTSWDWLSKGVLILRRSRTGAPVGLAVRFYDKWILENMDLKYSKNANNPLIDSTEYLFGYHKAAQQGNHSPIVFVVEGELDTLSIQLRGFDSVVCAGRGVLHDSQIAALEKLGKQIVIVTDADTNNAGQSNARDMAYKYPQISFMRLPLVDGQKMDPDTFVQRFGIDQFTKLHIETARMTRMMHEEMAQLPNGNLVWKYPEALAKKYLDEILRDTANFTVREVDYVAALSGNPKEQMLSWLMRMRNQMAVDYAVANGIPIQMQPMA